MFVSCAAGEAKLCGRVGEWECLSTLEAAAAAAAEAATESSQCNNCMIS